MKYHPFAEFIKILGRGRHGSRSLTQQEAYQAMQMIVQGEVEREQITVFLMLIRIREETPEEAAGFVQALRESIVLPDNAIIPDIDWGSYAGKRRHLPWFLLALKILAQQGYKILLHGAAHLTEDRVYTAQVIDKLGIPLSESFENTNSLFKQFSIVFMPLSNISSLLQEMIDLRFLLGLRSPMHSVARMLNPMQAKHSVHGIFHPNYAKIHQNTAQLLEDPSVMVFKGEGGEAEINPDVDTHILQYQNQQMQEFIWPATFKSIQKHLKDMEMNAEKLILLWEGKIKDEYAHAAIIATLAVVIQQLKVSQTSEQALELAQYWWQDRLAR